MVCPGTGRMIMRWLLISQVSRTDMNNTGRFITHLPPSPSLSALFYYYSSRVDASGVICIPWIARKARPGGEKSQVGGVRRELWWIWSLFFKPHLCHIITCYSNRWLGGGLQLSNTYLFSPAAICPHHEALKKDWYSFFNFPCDDLFTAALSLLCVGVSCGTEGRGGSWIIDFISLSPFSFSIFLILQGDCVPISNSSLCQRAIRLSLSLPVILRLHGVKEG